MWRYVNNGKAVLLNGPLKRNGKDPSRLVLDAGNSQPAQGRGQLAQRVCNAILSIPLLVGDQCHEADDNSKEKYSLSY